MKKWQVYVDENKVGVAPDVLLNSKPELTGLTGLKWRTYEVDSETKEEAESLVKGLKEFQPNYSIRETFDVTNDG